MGFLRSSLRRYALTAGVTLSVMSVTLAGPAAAQVLPTTTTTADPATTTSTTVATTAPTSSTLPATTTTSTPSTTSAGGPPATGVPKIPTAGPPTTPPPPGQTVPPPAPIDLTPAVDGVNADLAQLAAISSFAQVQAGVGIAQQQLVAAQGVLTAAQADAAVVERRRQAAVDRLATARAGMAHLALAAYTGEAYAMPGSPQALSPTGTVSTIGGRSADAAAEADVLLGVVVEETKQAVTVGRAGLAAADADSARAAAAVAAAQGGVGAATNGVTSAQHALAVATKAATVAGAAAQQASATPPGTPPTTARSSGRTTTTKLAVAAVADPGPSVLGPSIVTGPELAAWFATTGHTANTTVPIAQLAADYLAAGGQTGVRADLAFTQSIIETGYFSFPAGGQLGGADNNFAGIGACDSCSHGWTFPDALTGVTAQMELLEAYASPTKVPTPLIGPVGVGGCCSTWTALAGTWASNKSYGLEILSLYKRILDWVIPQRLLATGLAAPGSVVPAPPGTEASGPAGPAPAGATPAGGTPGGAAPAGAAPAGAAPAGVQAGGAAPVGSPAGGAVPAGAPATTTAPRG